MALIWERNGDAYYATITDLDGEVLFHLGVEKNGTGWEWIVWRPGETEQTARHGRAGTVQDAMREAEQAAG